MTIDDPQDLSKTAADATVAGADDPIEIEEETPTIPPLGDAAGASLAMAAAGQGPVRKPVPPPKPASRETLPSQPPEERVAPASIPAPRARVISVGGGSTPPTPSGSAAAWTRPLSEPPALRSNPPSPSISQKPTAPSVDLRSKLGIPRATNETQRSRVDTPQSDLEGLRIVPPPSLRAPEASSSPEPPARRDEPPKPAAPAPATSKVAVPARSPTVPSTPAPAAPKANPSLAAKAPDGSAAASPPRATSTTATKDSEPPPSSEPPTPRASARSRSSEPSARASSPEGALSDAVAARPKSEPARLRGGPPRPRASSPGFVAARSPGSPPRPTPRAPGAPAGSTVEVQRGDVPGPPRVPNFALSAGVSPVRSESSSPRKSEPPVTASAIAVMRIIAVGSPSREPVVEVEDDLLEQDSETQPEPEATAPAKAAEAHAEVLEELADEDIAPDSSDPIDSGAELRTGNRERREKAAAPPTPPSAREADLPKPPPPPSRKPKSPSLPKVPQAKRRQKRPWWEDVFGEDFVRTTFRYTDDQVRREVDFIEEALGVASGGVMLDLGCGPGHHAVELTSRGYGVVGYDLSLYQLALASEVAHERGQKLNFLQGDMREMAFEEMFDGIFSWNTSFGYFEEEKNVHVVERVFRALRPGGMFLLDVVNRDFVAASSPCQLWYEGDACVCMDDMNLDFITSRMCVKRSIILDDGRTRELVYSIRVYSLHELGKILHDVGFRVTEASGHPSTPGVFFGEHSPRIIILAQKP